MRKFNSEYYAWQIGGRIMKEYYEYSMITVETYDLIELFYRASGCKNQQEFCERFVIVGPSGERFQALFYEEDEGFDQTWGWVVDTNLMDEIMDREDFEEISIDHEEDC